MNKTIRHFHACADCLAQTPCTGDLFDNYDGEPWIICDEYHQIGGGTALDFLCDACELKRYDIAQADLRENV